MNILLGVTGSVAAIKTWELIRELEKLGETKAVLTNTSEFFSNKNKPGGRLGKIYRDKDEWQWNKIGDPIAHIELKDWADIFVIAPLSANTLAKMVNGMCDNLLTSVYRAWPSRKPIVLAPAMNTDMWNHPVTQEHLTILRRRHGYTVQYIHGYYSCRLEVIDPIEGNLACGIHGIGAMASVETITGTVRKYLK